MPSESSPIKQRWMVRIALKSGAVADIITEEHPDDLRDRIRSFLNIDNPLVVIGGINEKGWPIYLEVDPHEITMRLSSPHEVYIAARPTLVQT